MEEWVSERLSGCLGISYQPLSSNKSYKEEDTSIGDFLKPGGHKASLFLQRERTASPTGPDEPRRGLHATSTAEEVSEVDPAKDTSILYQSIDDLELIDGAVQREPQGRDIMHTQPLQKEASDCPLLGPNIVESPQISADLHVTVKAGGRSDLLPRNVFQTWWPTFASLMCKYPVLPPNCLLEVKQGSAPLVVPLENLKEAAAADDDLMSSLEHAVADWTHVLQTVLLEEAQTGPQGPGPLAELEMWRRRCTRLTGLYEQISSASASRNILCCAEHVHGS
eukprot:jgi/Botrbrau1/4452/Bobra.0348s0038.1